MLIDVLFGAFLVVSTVYAVVASLRDRRPHEVDMAIVRELFPDRHEEEENVAGREGVGHR